MDDFEDIVTSSVNTTNTNQTVTNQTKVNQTNTTEVNTTVKAPKKSIEIEKFGKIVKGVMKGYEQIMNVSQKEVAGKKDKLQRNIEKLNRDVVVMKKQIIDIDAQIKEKVKQIEDSQEAINKQQTSLKVFEEQLKKNAEEKDLKLKEQVDKDLKQTIVNAKKQRKESIKQQTKLIVDLRRLYRQKKRLVRDIREHNDQVHILTDRVTHIEELTNLKVKEIQGVIAWLQKKLEEREELFAKLAEVSQSISESLPLLEQNVTKNDNTTGFVETVKQLKKVKFSLLKQIKNIRTLLNARIGVYNKTKIARKAYIARKQRLSDEERKLRKEMAKLLKNVTQLKLKVQKQDAHFKKQTVDILRDISASKLSELRGELNANNAKLIKVQRKLTLLTKTQLKVRKDYDEDLKKINKEFQKYKMITLKKTRRAALIEKRRLEKRIARLERAMIDDKYNGAQIKSFAEKAEVLRKKVPEINERIQNVTHKIEFEENKMKEMREKQFRHLQEVAKKLKEREEELISEDNVLKEKISQSTNKLEKSGLLEDYRDVSRRLAVARVRSNIAVRAVQKLQHRMLSHLKNELNDERKMIKIYEKSKQRTLKRIAVLKNHQEFSKIVEELERRVGDMNIQIEEHRKALAIVESKVAETTRMINEEVKMNIVVIESRLKRIRSRKEDIADILGRILRESKRDSIQELRENTKKMKQLKKELVTLNMEEIRIRKEMEKLNKIVLMRSLEDKIVKASRKSRELITAMKKSSRKVRRMRAKLVRNKRYINKLYKQVHDSKDVISEKIEDKLDQLKNIRAILKNDMKRIMFEHKKLQESLLKHVEAVKKLSKYRIKNFHKEHGEILEKRNQLMKKREQIKKDKGSEYFYTQLDMLDEKMSDLLREERIYKYKIEKRLSKMIAIAKECEKKTTPGGIAGIRFKCTMCRNLAAYMLQKIRRDRMSRKEVLKKMYNRCERSVDPSLCLRTTLKLSIQAFQERNKDLTPKELCYKAGRCVLQV